MTVGGYKLAYEDDPNSPAISLLNTQIFLNSIISDAYTGARFCTADMKVHYLQLPMKNYHYMRIPLKYFTEEIHKEYDIMDIADHGYIYIEIRKGMYGLKEARIFDFNYIVKNLAPFRYTLVKYTPGLWKRDTRPTAFKLYVDDFCSKYHTT